MAYLTYYWLDQEDQIILDPQNEVANTVFEFIEGALEKTESVLVSSVKGQSRASVVIAVYIMRKY